MMACRSGIMDKTLEEFYNENKDMKNALVIGGPITLLRLEVGNYYGIVNTNGEKLVLKCIEKDAQFGKRPVFLSVNGIVGPLTIKEVLWEKSEEEMFKPDCCNEKM